MTTPGLDPLVSALQEPEPRSPLDRDDLLVLAATSVVWTPFTQHPRAPLHSDLRARLRAALTVFHPGPSLPSSLPPPGGHQVLARAWSDLLDAVAELAPVFAEIYGEDASREVLVLRSACWAVFDLVAARTAMEPYRKTLFRDASVGELCRAARYADLPFSGCFDPLGVFLARKNPDVASMDWLRVVSGTASRLRAE